MRNVRLHYRKCTSAILLWDTAVPKKPALGRDMTATRELQDTTMPKTPTPHQSMGAELEGETRRGSCGSEICLENGLVKQYQRYQHREQWCNNTTGEQHEHMAMTTGGETNTRHCRCWCIRLRNALECDHYGQRRCFRLLYLDCRITRGQICMPAQRNQQHEHRKPPRELLIRPK